jgi:hypothetical protein
MKRELTYEKANINEDGSIDVNEITIETDDTFEPAWIDQKLELPDADANLICNEIALDCILYFDPDAEVELLIENWENLNMRGKENG